MYIVSSRYVTSAIHARVPSPSTMLTKLFMYATTKREFFRILRKKNSKMLSARRMLFLYILISEIRESEILLKPIYIEIYNKYFIKC